MGENAPVGSHQHKPNCRCRRPRLRTCLRRGCGQKFQPRRYNQRYCQDAACLRAVRRWQAAKRQAQRRADEAVKAQHAAAQRARRQSAKSVPQPPKEPEAAPARGHAAKIFFLRPVCKRPGCYEPPHKSGRNQATYCCFTCRQAVRRVVDRERKWRQRGAFQGRRARQREYQAARARRHGRRPDGDRSPLSQPAPL